MQKTLNLLIFSLVLSVSSFAQQFPYQFTYTNEPYASLSNANLLDNSAVFDDLGTAIPLGFNFHFGGKNYTSLNLGGYEGALAPQDAFLGDTVDAIFAYATEGMSFNAGTVVKYKTEGVAPNRIAKMEVFRAETFDGSGEVSYQYWLYETTNAIQIRLGHQDIPNPEMAFFNEKSPLIGFMLDYHDLTDDIAVFPQAQFVVGSPAAPEDSVIINDLLDYTESEVPLYGMTGVPLDNSVFTFTPGTVGTGQPQATEALLLWPNPAQDLVHFKGIDARQAGILQLLDARGSVVATVELPAGTSAFRLPAGLDPGFYTVCYQGRDGKLIRGKLVKG